MATERFYEPARFIDHTLLLPEATRNDIERLCLQAKKYGFFSVCVNPWWVRAAKESCKNSNVRVCSVVGFPLGMSRTKVHEAKRAIDDGADELDMVLAIGALKSKLYADVKLDIEQVVKLGKPVKVILETGLLSNAEIQQACQLSVEAQAAFVKTSTGFSAKGATINIVKIMKAEVKDLIGIKASGGIKSLKSLRHMVEAGASRIGTSSSVAIMEEFKKEIRK